MANHLLLCLILVNKRRALRGYRVRYKIMCDFKEEKETLWVISKQIAVEIQNARKFEKLR